MPEDLGTPTGAPARSGSPPHRPLQIVVSTHPGPGSGHGEPVAVRLIAVSGEVDTVTASLLDTIVAETLTASGGPHPTRREGVVLDVSAATFRGAAGFAAIGRTADVARRVRAVYAVAGLSPLLGRQLTSRRPGPPPALHPDVPTAMAAVGSRGPEVEPPDAGPGSGVTAADVEAAATARRDDGSASPSALAGDLLIAAVAFSAQAVLDLAATAFGERDPVRSSRAGPGAE